MFISKEIKERIAGIKPQIEVIGPVGAGKTTFSELLGGYLGVKPIYENYMNNPYLTKFYSEPKKYSFHSQMWFLLDRIYALSNGDSPLVDAGLIMYLCYARAQNIMEMMCDKEFGIYKQTRSALKEAKKIPNPNFVFILTASPDKLQKHIADRGRIFEKGVWKDYLQTLSNVVDNFQEELDINIPSFRIDTGVNDLLDHSFFENSKDEIETFLGFKVNV